jgi:hypothetical protein
MQIPRITHDPGFVAGKSCTRALRVRVGTVFGLLAVSVFSMTASAGPATSPSTTRAAADADAARLGASAGLVLIKTMREGATETGLDEALKQQLIDALDVSRQKVLDNIASTSSGSMSFEERAAALRGVVEQQNEALQQLVRQIRAVEGGPVAERALLRQIGRVRNEIRLLGRGTKPVLNTLAPLGLSDEQQAEVRTVLDSLAKALKDDGAQEGEDRTNALLAARGRLRRVLSKEQRERWSAGLEQDDARERGFTARPAQPVPARRR